MLKTQGIIVFAFALSVWSSVWTSGLTIHAQEESLETLQQQWTEMQIQFARKEAAFSTGGQNSSQSQTEYRDLIVKANELIGRMKKLALERVKEKPADAAALRLLMGILVNEVSRGQEQTVLSTGDELISLGIDAPVFEMAAKTERLTIAGREIFEELAIRQREAKQDDLPRVELETNKGKLVLELFENHAPNTVNNFISLIESGRFNDIQFHRVIDGFMAQAGQSKGDGTALPELDYTIACESHLPETRQHFSYCIGMALNSDSSGGVIKDSGAGQFFITLGRVDNLDGKHTCFGRVIQGTDVLETIQKTASADDTPIPNVTPDRILAAKVLRKREHKYEPKKLALSKSSPTSNDEKQSAESANGESDSNDEASKDSPANETLELPKGD